MRAVLGSLRKLVLGETWTVPAGVAGALAVALLTRALLPLEIWTSAGGFVLAAGVAMALALSLGLPDLRGWAARHSRRTKSSSPGFRRHRT